MIKRKRFFPVQMLFWKEPKEIIKNVFQIGAKEKSTSNIYPHITLDMSMDGALHIYNNNACHTANVLSWKWSVLNKTSHSLITFTLSTTSILTLPQEISNGHFFSDTPTHPQRPIQNSNCGIQ